MDIDDTIAAIATPVGEGAVGIIRISGREAIRIASRVFRPSGGIKLEDLGSHRIVYGHVLDTGSGRPLDEVLVSVMRGPRSYTREDIVEINCHGGYSSLRSSLRAVLEAGARLAQPGEFTRRAFLNGRIDLTQAEAVLDLIRAKTDKAEMMALRQLEGSLSSRIEAISRSLMHLCGAIEARIDFPDDDIPEEDIDQTILTLGRIRGDIETLVRGFVHGRLLREGVAAAIVGKPNVGKSSLLNALVMKDRAIVTALPGTTRDVIEEFLDIDGLPVRIMDTAGIRESQDVVEKEGVQRSLEAMKKADIVLAVFDGSREFDELDGEILDKARSLRTIFVVNKMDIGSPLFRIPLPHLTQSAALNESSCATGQCPAGIVRISALTGAGLSELKNAIFGICMDSAERAEAEGLLITNIRHKQAAEHAITSIGRAEDSLNGGEPLEVAALFVREALQNLGTITGAVTSDDILDLIFREFCIGK